MAPAHPFWKGYLKLSLVSCPIALYTASSSTERVSFRQINKKTGNRLRQQFVDEVTREPVDNVDKGRGYEYSKNAYMANAAPLKSRFYNELVPPCLIFVAAPKIRARTRR